MHHTWVLRYELVRNRHCICERNTEEAFFRSEIYEDKFQETEKSEILSETGSDRDKSVIVEPSTAKD